MIVARESEYIQQNTSTIINSFKTNKEMDVMQFLVLFFSTFRNEKRLMKNLINSDLTHLLNITFQSNAEYLISDYEKNNWYKNVVIEPYKIHFITGGLIEVLIKWSQNSMNESDIEMAQRISHYLLI